MNVDIEDDKVFIGPTFYNGHHLFSLNSINGIQIEEAIINKLSDIQHINAASYHHKFDGSETELEVQSLNINKLSAAFDRSEYMSKYISLLSNVKKLIVYSHENVNMNYPPNVYKVIYCCELRSGGSYQLSTPVVVFTPCLLKTFDNNITLLVDPLVVKRVVVTIETMHDLEFARYLASYMSIYKITVQITNKCIY